MQQNNFDGYYDIYFEKTPNIIDIKNILLRFFPNSNMQISHNHHCFEIINDNHGNLFDVYVDFIDLKDDNKLQIYQDVAVISLLYISPILNKISSDIINILKVFSQKNSFKNLYFND